MKTFYLFRHGESESNQPDASYQGEWAQLTPKGRQETTRLSLRLQPLKFDQVISSTSARAIETARLLTNYPEAEFTTTDLFTEREHPSSLIGTPRDSSQYQTIKAKVTEHFCRNEKYADEESFSELCERAKKFATLLTASPGEKILVVGHGKFTKFFITYLCFGEALTPTIVCQVEKFFKSRNLGLTELCFNETNQQWTLHQWNASLSIEELN